MTEELPHAKTQPLLGPESENYGTQSPNSPQSPQITEEEIPQPEEEEKSFNISDKAQRLKENEKGTQTDIDSEQPNDNTKDECCRSICSTKCLKGSIQFCQLYLYQSTKAFLIVTAMIWIATLVIILVSVLAFDQIGATVLCCILAIISCCLAMILISLCECKWGIVKDYALDDHPKGKIRNPLVALVCISKYWEYNSRRYNKSLILKDLGAVDEDLPRLRALYRDTYKYTLMDFQTVQSRTETEWTGDEIIKAVRLTASELSKNIGSGKEYDGLIFAFSGHGAEGIIYSSDTCAIHKNGIHRIFSVEYPNCRVIPRIFIWDSCSGHWQNENAEERKDDEDSEQNKLEYYTIHKERKEKSANFDMHDVNAGEDVETSWMKQELNPDYNLMQIHGAPPGFQARSNVDSGSDLMCALEEKLVEAFEKDVFRTIGTLLRAIESDFSPTKFITWTANSGSDRYVLYPNIKDRQ